MKQGNYPNINAKDYGKYIDLRIVDPIIELHLDTIDYWTYVTYDFGRMTNLAVSNIFASDDPKINTISSAIYGVTPTLLNVTGNKFLKIYYENTTTDLGLAEQLFTARGT